MVCLPPGFVFLFFLYNCTAFENYVSCNDLILLIVIQKKLSFPPSNYPGGTDGPEKRPIQRGLYPGGNKKQKEEGGEKKNNQKSTKRCVASVSQEWGPGCCLG